MNWVGRVGAASAVLSAGAMMASAGEVEVQFRVAVPADTPPGAVVYIAGDDAALGAWNPGAVALERFPDGRWGRTLRLPEGRTLKFKFTLGGWDRVEKDASGSERANRELVLPPGEAIGPGGVLFTVDRWSVGGAEKHSTVTGDLRTHVLKAQAVAGDREVFVWVPPGYRDDAAGTYPVIYFHDGQNCFDEARSAFGAEWGLDEAMTRGVGSGAVKPAIIVGVSNSAARVQEYTPTIGGQPNPMFDAYDRFLTREVIPFVESHYRVRTDVAGRGLAGSSLGGLATLDLLRRHPDLFGSVAVVSPSLWWDGQHDLKSAEGGAVWASGRRVWVDMGTAEGNREMSAAYVEQVRRLAAVLGRAGATVECRIVDGADHSERAWAKRADDILQFLLGGDASPARTGARP